MVVSSNQIAKLFKLNKPLVQFIYLFLFNVGKELQGNDSQTTAHTENSIRLEAYSVVYVFVFYF
jgi:hypothetical protein